MATLSMGSGRMATSTTEGLIITRMVTSRQRSRQMIRFYAPLAILGDKPEAGPGFVQFKSVQIVSKFRNFLSNFPPSLA